MTSANDACDEHICLATNLPGLAPGRKVQLIDACALTLLPGSAAGLHEIKPLGYTIHPDAYRIGADVTIRGPRPGGELRERRGRSAHTVPNEPHEQHVVPWSPHLSAGTASGPGIRIDHRRPAQDLPSDRNAMRHNVVRRVCRPDRRTHG